MFSLSAHYSFYFKQNENDNFVLNIIIYYFINVIKCQRSYSFCYEI